ncbi:MAG TPA: hypothetical protein GXX23_00435 [Firmicutes bacterium]|nr:hypothetical protein [Candidatus Fermentithermobacillaceae bacterium]
MKRNLGRIGIAVLGILAVASLLFGANQYRQAQAAQLAITGMQQRAMFSLISHVENIEGCLAKARAASTVGQQTSFLTATWSHAQAAAENLAQFGMASTDLTAIRQFVSRIGDYCLVLSQKLARGDSVTQAEWSELKRLETSTKDLAAALSDMGRQALSSGRRIGKASLASLFLGAPAVDDWLNDGFSELDTMTQSIPSPIYDGPFSEANQRAMALARPGTPIDMEAAKNIAGTFLRPGESFQSVRVEDCEGSIPSFLVTHKRPDGTEITTAVAKQGGYVVWCADSETPTSVPAAAVPEGQNLDRARQAAKDFLASKGFSSLVETGWRRPGAGSGRVVFNFVPEVTVGKGEDAEPCRLYPDLVKVEVSEADGKVISFDQRGYLTTNDHPSRILREPLVSKEEARAVLKKDLQVQGDGRLCVIPMLPTREVMAWEFNCKEGDDTYLVYINAMNGQEEAIFQVIESEEGSLTV